LFKAFAKDRRLNEVRSAIVMMENFLRGLGRRRGVDRRKEDQKGNHDQEIYGTGTKAQLRDSEKGESLQVILRRLLLPIFVDILVSEFR
jgi:hypothetical protein